MQVRSMINSELINLLDGINPDALVVVRTEDHQYKEVMAVRDIQVLFRTGNKPLIVLELCN